MLSLWRKTAPDVVVVSPEVMGLLLNKVLDIMTGDVRHRHHWDFTRFRGEWAQWVANRVDDCGDGDHQDPAGPAHEALRESGIEGRDLLSSVVLWHLVTSICLLASDGPGELTNPSKELSNYIMYLVAKLKVMVDSNGHFVISRCQREVQGGERISCSYDGSYHEMIDDLPTDLHQEGFIQKLREGDKYYQSQSRLIIKGDRAPSTARRASVALLKIPDARDRWDLIAAVWTEILCYMALNCGAAFHAKHLTTGGEFLTQVKMLLFVVRLPFLRNVTYMR
ncbi:hypothetical protein BS78_09G048700 [Paspalum vaginatum]|nr:hypothetical protein BS78_09G048700 [Paspalum vaginatum]